MDNVRGRRRRFTAAGLILGAGSFLLVSCGGIDWVGNADYSASVEPNSYGDDWQLDDLWDACEAGDEDACQALYWDSPLDSAYEDFAVSRIAGVSPTWDSIKAYEDILRQYLEWGAIVYTTPDQMNVGDRTTVTARITRDDLDSLSDEIYEGLGDVGGGGAQAAALQVSTSMRATLEGDAFDIEHIGPEVQQLRKTGHREWVWQIEALRSGQWPLYLTLYAVFEEQDVDHATLEREITVTVSPVSAVRDFFIRNWQWLVMLLVTAFGGAGFGPTLIRKLRGRPPTRQRRQDRSAPDKPSKEQVSSPSISGQVEPLSTSDGRTITPDPQPETPPAKRPWP